MKPRAKQIVIFLSLFSLILGMLHFYLYQRSVYYLQPDTDLTNFLSYLFGSLMILTLAAMPLTRVLPRSFATALSFIVYPWMGFGLLLITMFFIADLLWIPLNLIATISLSSQLQKTFGFAVFIIAATFGA